MCLAIPGKVIEMFEENGLRMGKIDYEGTINMACLEYVPDVKSGEYVIVHAGFAISVIDEIDAARTIELWKEIVKRSAEDGHDIYGMSLDDTSKDALGGDNR